MIWKIRTDQLGCVKCLSLRLAFGFALVFHRLTVSNGRWYPFTLLAFVHHTSARNVRTPTWYSYLVILLCFVHSFVTFSAFIFHPFSALLWPRSLGRMRKAEDAINRCWLRCTTEKTLSFYALCLCSSATLLQRATCSVRNLLFTDCDMP